MKTKKIELDIEFIGSQSPLTKAEENLISEYFSKRKKKVTISRSSKKPTVRRRSKISVWLWKEVATRHNTALPKHYFLTLFIFIFR